MRHSAFTLIELLVAIGLMAILLSMIATIFFQATQAFRMARASIEIHQNARAVLNALEKDISAAQFRQYGTNNVQGYFALTPGPVAQTTGAYAPPDPTRAYTDPRYSPAPLAADGVTAIPADTLTFTTLAPQPGALYAAPEAVQQTALVRYALQWDGGSATLPATLPGTRVARPTYTLVKRVRFPHTNNNPNLNMDDFNFADLGIENSANDLVYAEPESQAFKVLSMSIRLFCRAPVVNGTLSPLQVFSYGGMAMGSGDTATSLVDNWRNWTVPAASLVRLVAGDGAPATAFPINNAPVAPGSAIGINSPGWTAPPAVSILPTQITYWSGYNNERPPVGNVPPYELGTQYQIIQNIPTYRGTATGTGTVTTLVDNTAGRQNANGLYVQITAGTGAPATIFPVISDDGTTITINSAINPPGWTTPPVAGTQYQIIPSIPTWLQRTNDPNFGTNPVLGMVAGPPALVEITLELTDQRATRSFSFTERFYIPASER